MALALHLDHAGLLVGCLMRRGGPSSSASFFLPAAPPRTLPLSPSSFFLPAHTRLLPLPLPCFSLQAQHAQQVVGRMGVGCWDLWLCLVGRWLLLVLVLVLVVLF